MKTLLKLLLIPILPIVGATAWIYTSPTAERSGVRLLTSEGLKAVAAGDVKTAGRFFNTAWRFAPFRQKRRPQAVPVAQPTGLPALRDLLSGKAPAGEKTPPSDSAMEQRVAEIKSEQNKALAEGNYIWSQHWLMAGDKQRAAQLIDEGLRMDPENANLQQALAELDALLGKK